LFRFVQIILLAVALGFTSFIFVNFIRGFLLVVLILPGLGGLVLLGHQGLICRVPKGFNRC